MSETLTVLFSCAGRRVGLIRCFEASAAALGVRLHVVATDARPELSAACQVASVAVPVPPIAAPDYAEAVRRVCADHAVQLVVPTIDPDLAALAPLRDELRLNGTRVMISDPETIRVTSDKHLTYLALEGAVPVPDTVRADRADQSRLGGSSILKPRWGSASVGVKRISPGTVSPQDLVAENVVQELLPGVEHTVNCYVDQRGRLVGAVPHQRLEVRGGEVSKARTVKHEHLEQIAADITGVLPGLRGAFCFQGFVEADRCTGVFEINARFGGGYPVAQRAGAHFAEACLREALGRGSPEPFVWEPGVTMLRYDAEVFG